MVWAVLEFLKKSELTVVKFKEICDSNGIKIINQKAMIKFKTAKQPVACTDFTLTSDIDYQWAMAT